MNQIEVQRQVTAAFIADDPTTAALTPYTRVKVAGAFQDTAGTPRAPQTFKLSLLAFDQRPTVTVAGVEREAEYHLIGPHDMAIAVGDRWDDNGTKYEVLGFTEGWGYMTKAFIARTIPRDARP